MYERTDQDRGTTVAERPRVLMTLADVAWPVDAGKRLRTEAMVRAVAARCEIDVVVLFADADPAVSPLPPDIAGGWEVIEPVPQSAPRAAAALLRDRLPWQIAVQNWNVVRQRLAARDGAYDLVWFGALDHFAQLHRSITAPHVIVDCDDVETEKLRRFLSLPRSAALPLKDQVQRRVELPLWARIQRQAVLGADAVLVCSELDRSRLIAETVAVNPESAARIVSVPNTYPTPVEVGARDPRGTCTLVVVANFGTDQNLDAATFAALEILPPLRAAIPDATIRLVGRRADRLEALQGIEGLEIVGPVESVAGELERAHAVLVPIRFGGGTRLKVVEALAYGVPVISTRAGAEGIEATDGEELLLADDPAGIVAAVQRLLADPGLAARLAERGHAVYDSHYRPEATVAKVGALLERVMSG
jgi:glycosyltransferase involved in cell wall biosynthesis